MRILVLLLACLTAAVLPAHAQQTQQAEPPDGTRISSAAVSGFEVDRLSPGLQEEIKKLTGSPLNRQQLKDLAARIEGERPRFVAAIRVTAEPDGTARVVFVVARITESEQQTNVNTKYVVSDVKIIGVDEDKISADILADAKALTGKPLDDEQAQKLGAKLEAAFPNYNLSRRTSRAEQTGTIKVVYELTRTEASRWLRFEPLKAHGTYHSDQGWSWFGDVPIGDGNVRVTPFFALDTTEYLLEEYSGLGIRFESRKLGTERLGVSIEWAWFDNEWRPSTLAAMSLDPTLPRPYEDRFTFTPMASFAITPHLRISGGVSINELQPLPDFPFGHQAANAAVGSIGYNYQHKEKHGPRHIFDAGFTVRSGLDGLSSDYSYTRALGQAEYTFKQGDHQVLVNAMGGVINGRAPMFERFALGDVRTLRGWDKYQISPTGGDQMVYGSIEYRWSALALFVDTGSVWSEGQTRKFRASTGVGIHGGPFFMTLGVPLNTNDLRAVFTIGLRFPGSQIFKY